MYMEALGCMWKLWGVRGGLGCVWRFGVYVEVWGLCGGLGSVWRLWGVREVWEHTQQAPPAIPSTRAQT